MLRYISCVIIGVFLILLTSEGILRWLYPEHLKSGAHTGLLLKKIDSDLGAQLLKPSNRVEHTVEGMRVEYTINSQGFRDRIDHSHRMDENQTRVLVLGDSFTFGFGVPYEFTWPVVFERLLLDHGYYVDVIKTGVLGFNTRKELRYLERLLPEYQPDIVILAFMAHDIFENTRSNGEETRNENGFKLIHAPEPKLLTLKFAKSALFAYDFTYGLIYLATQRRQFFTMPLSPLAKSQTKLTKDLLLEMFNYCRQNESTFVVLSIPQQFQVRVPQTVFPFSRIDVRWIDKDFGALASRSGFLWIPTREALTQEYQRSKDPLYFLVDGHLNSRGQQVVGQYFFERFEILLGDRLRRKEIIDPG